MACEDSEEVLEMEENESMSDEQEGNEGWADVMDKILKTGTGPKDTETDKKKRKKPLILSKAKTDSEIATKISRKNDDFEIATVENEIKVDSNDASNSSKLKETKSIVKDEVLSYKEMKQKLKEERIQKADWENRNRKKPDITQRHKEKMLQRVATRGVVQLFNAIRQRQVTIEQKFDEVGKSELKKEKVLKSMTKQDFLDKLKTTSKSLTNEEAQVLKSIKKEKPDKDEDKPAWSILRDDYMMGAQMKDWDKESESDVEEI